MAKSKLVKANQQIATEVTEGFQKMCDHVTGGFQHISDTVEIGRASCRERVLRLV